MNDRDAARPTLPAGWTAQPVRSLRNRSGRDTSELHLVYAPVAPLRNRVEVDGQLLDEARSYWLITSSSHGGGEDQRPSGRWVSFADARARGGRRMTFARFSTLADLAEVLPPL